MHTLAHNTRTHAHTHTRIRSYEKAQKPLSSYEADVNEFLNKQDEVAHEESTANVKFLFIDCGPLKQALRCARSGGEGGRLRAQPGRGGRADGDLVGEEQRQGHTATQQWVCHPPTRPPGCTGAAAAPTATLVAPS